MPEIDYGDSEICQNLTHFVENILVTNLIRQTKFNNGPLE